jgi:plasmid replication initiation protein
MAIKDNYLVEKRNTLNEIRSNNMTLQELRFFSIYLSRINARDIKTRVVRFKLDDFKAIMELESRIKIDHMKSVTNRLLGKVVNVPNEVTGGYEAFQLFKRCRVDKDEFGEWFVEIDAHDDALPLMFDFKDGYYFKYELWNALGLASKNQFRMYELLKQHEKKGARIVRVEELRELLGIKKDDYKRPDSFKRDVIDVCKKALEENTDIVFTYESYGKKGAGGKILQLRFTIRKNPKHVDRMKLDDFIGKNKVSEEPVDENAIEADAEVHAQDYEPESRIGMILAQYRELNLGRKFAQLSDDELLELNQTAADYLVGAGRADELNSLLQYAEKQALYTNSKNPKQKYFGYLLKAAKNNYAKA